MHIKQDIQNKKQHKIWECEREATRKNITSVMQEIDDMSQIPHPDTAVQAFMADPYVISVENLLIGLSDSGRLPTAQELEAINNILIISLLCRNCHRREALENMSVYHWFGRLKNKPCPFLPYDNDQNVNLKRKSNESEENRGSIIKITIHKNSSKYDLYLFLTKFDVYLLQCYENMRNKLLENLGLDPLHLESCFFVNSKGAPYLTKKSVLKMEPFCRPNGITYASSHIFRKMFSSYIARTGDPRMKDAERYAACHSAEVAESTYVENQIKQQKAVAAIEEYHKHHGGEESRKERIVEKEVSSEQKSRERVARISIEQRNLQIILAQEELKDNKKPISVHSLVNTETKVSLLLLILDELRGNFPRINSKGTLAKLILSGGQKQTVSLTPTIMRCIDTIPEENISRIILERHLVLFTAIKLPVLNSLREVERTWVDCLLRALYRNSRIEKPFTSRRIIKALYDISQEVGHLNFCFGSPPIERQIANWKETKLIPEEESLDQEMMKIKPTTETDKQGQDEDKEYDQDQDTMQCDSANVTAVEEESEVEAGPSTRGEEQTKQKRMTWTPNMKRFMLGIFLTKAEDPLVKGLSDIRTQLNLIIQQNPSIGLYDKDKSRRKLADLNLDSIAQMFYRKGGLSEYIHSWIAKEKKENRVYSKDQIKDQRFKILELFNVT